MKIAYDINGIIIRLYPDESQAPEGIPVLEDVSEKTGYIIDRVDVSIKPPAVIYRKIAADTLEDRLQNLEIAIAELYGMGVE